MIPNPQGINTYVFWLDADITKEFTLDQLDQIALSPDPTPKTISKENDVT